jgi:hypothetical protein
MLRFLSEAVTESNFVCAASIYELFWSSRGAKVHWLAMHIATLVRMHYSAANQLQVITRLFSFSTLRKDSFIFRFDAENPFSAFSTVL